MKKYKITSYNMNTAWVEAENALKAVEVFSGIFPKLHFVVAVDAPDDIPSVTKTPEDNLPPEQLQDEQPK